MAVSVQLPNPAESLFKVHVKSYELCVWLQASCPIGAARTWPATWCWIWEWIGGEGQTGLRQCCKTMMCAVTGATGWPLPASLAAASTTSTSQSSPRSVSSKGLAHMASLTYSAVADVVWMYAQLLHGTVTHIPLDGHPLSDADMALVTEHICLAFADTVLFMSSFSAAAMCAPSLPVNHAVPYPPCCCHSLIHKDMFVITASHLSPLAQHSKLQGTYKLLTIKQGYSSLIR